MELGSLQASFDSLNRVHWLAEPDADASLRQAIIAEVEILDQRPVSVLMSLLARVNPDAKFPSTLRGIQ
jgi:2-methylcitrate dehydratase